MSGPALVRIQPIVTSGGVTTDTFHQAVPASTWTVPHALGRRPQVEVTDDDGFDLLAEVFVMPTAPFTVSIIHGSALTGWVYLT